MAIGQLLHATHATTPIPYYTPWAGRGGNAAVFAVDIIAANFGGGAVVITIQSKNSEDTDSVSGIDLGSFSAINTVPTSPATKYQAGLKELYRYKIEVAGDPADNWVHMRMLAPSWLRN
jgi:hypothetical protein